MARRNRNRTATSEIDAMNADRDEVDTLLENQGPEKDPVADLVDEPRTTPEATAQAIAATFGAAVVSVPEVEKEPYPRYKQLRRTIAVFTAFVTSVKFSTPALRRQATDHLIDVILTSLKVDESGGYNDVLTMFKVYGPYLSPSIALQGIANHPQSTVKKVGSYFAVMHALTRHLQSGGKIPFNMDIKGITSIFESTTLANFITLKLIK
jgi:hypothetical protein